MIRRTPPLACCHRRHAFGGLLDQARDRLRLRHIDRVTALTSTTVALARFAISRCAQSESSCRPSSADTSWAWSSMRLVDRAAQRVHTHGTCESAMNAAFSGLTSPANDGRELRLVEQHAGSFAARLAIRRRQPIKARRFPSCGGARTPAQIHRGSCGWRRPGQNDRAAVG